MITVINTQNAPKCMGPYVQAIKIQNIIFISGQIAICPKTGKMPITIKEQTYQTLKNIKEILKASGSNINHVVKITIFMTDLNDLDTMNTVYRIFFNGENRQFPTRSCIEVSHLPKNAKIEIEAIAIQQNNCK